MFHGLVIVDARLLNYNLYNMKKMNNKIRQICIILCLLVVSIILDNIFSFGHVTLAIAPAIIAAGIAAAGAIGGGLFGNSATKATNAANMKMAADTNATNIALQQQMNEFNLKQWNATNAYNTPLAQRQRFEDAGINPYMALGSMSSGTAQSSLTSAPAPNLVTPHNEAPMGLANGISQATAQAAQVAATMSQVKKTDAETRGQEITNQYSAAQMMANIDKMVQETHNYKLDSTFKTLQNNLYQDTYKNSVDLSDMNVQQAKANVNKTTADTALVNANISVAKAEASLRIKQGSQVDNEIQLARKRYIQDVKESNSRIGANGASAQASLASANLAYQNSLKVILEKNRINYTPDQLDALKLGDVEMQSQQVQESITRQHVNMKNAKSYEYKLGPLSISKSGNIW